MNSPLKLNMIIKKLKNSEKFVVPPSGGYCEIRRLSLHAIPPEGGTTNFLDLLKLTEYLLLKTGKQNGKDNM